MGALDVIQLSGGGLFPALIRDGLGLEAVRDAAAALIFRLHHDGAPMLDDLEGRYSPAQSERLLQGVVVTRQAELQWSADLVKARLEEAAEGAERLSCRVGPSRKMTSWINWELHKNLSDFDRNARAEGVRKGTRSADRMRISMSDREISRIEEALMWPARYLQDDVEARKALQLWSWCIARNEAWSRFGAAEFGSRGASNRRLERAFRLIAGGLEKDRVLA